MKCIVNILNDGKSGMLTSTGACTKVTVRQQGTTSMKCIANILNDEKSGMLASTKTGD